MFFSLFFWIAGAQWEMELMVPGIRTKFPFRKKFEHANAHGFQTKGVVIVQTAKLFVFIDFRIKFSVE